MNGSNKIEFDEDVDFEEDKKRNNLENILNSYKMSNNEIEDNDSEDSYELRLDKEIEANCEFKEYVDKLEVDEKDNDELVKMDKKAIIDFKNSQIRKYKQYIGSLEKEKQDLIENFKETTNVLLDKIKELEEKNFGERPQTAMIMDGIKQNKRNHNNKNNNYGKTDKENGNINKYSDLNTYDINNVNKLNKRNLEEEFFGKNDLKEDEKKEERCVKCKKFFPKNDFANHSLICLRKPMIVCRMCDESLEENEKESHIKFYRSISTIKKSIDDNNTDDFNKCLIHNFEWDKKIIDEDKGYYLAHYISEKGSVKLFSLCVNKQVNFDQITLKEKDSSLVRF